MLLEQLWQDVPELPNHIRRQSLVADAESVWVMLRQLMLAYAPSTGAVLPGSIFEQVSDIAAVFGLADRLDISLGGAGCAGLWLGVAKEQVDLVVLAHLDRLTFRVQSVQDEHTALVSPICVTNMSNEIVPAPARSFRFNAQRGRIQVVAQGQLSLGPDDAYYFEIERGSLAPLDLITLDLQPRRQGSWVRGSGLDNAAGVLSTLAVASVLRQVEEVLLEHNRRCLFIFPDRQDFSPDMLWTNGLGQNIRPALGTVMVDGQVIESETLHYEAGMGYSFASSGQCGLLVPTNYQQLTWDLASTFETYMPAIAQHNYVVGPGLSQPCIGDFRGRILGLMGPPVSSPHAGQEIVHIKDIQAGIWWLSCYLSFVLELVPSVSVKYALGR
ncbi:hypothetical protein ACFLYO_00610 [Chloroflexota bacterium]